MNAWLTAAEAYFTVNLGQSNMRTIPGQFAGNKNIPDGLWLWGNRDMQFGTRYLAPKFGRYPLDRHDDRDRYSNPLSLSFARNVIDATTKPLYSLTVAKVAHPIESFIRRATRKTNGWVIPSGKINLAPFLYGQVDEAMDAVPGSPEFAHVVCYHQGEANNGDTVGQYKAKLKALHADLVLMDVIGPDTLFICGGLVPTYAFHGTHRSACLAACAELPNAHYCESTGLTPLADGIHFTGQSLETLGTRYASRFLA